MKNTPLVGIDQLHFYAPHVYLDLEDLARVRNTDVDKFKVGIGQEKMALIRPNEDIITMAAEAAYPLVKGIENDIGLLLFATESGIDASKAAGIYLHALLNIQPYCRVLEVKQACYAATGALQLAVDYVKVNPNKKALVVSSDVAWYGFETPGEVTQGAGAIAMIVSANPRLAVVHEGYPYVQNVEDFYRPSFQEVPIVDGKLSIRSYRDVLRQVRPTEPLQYMCFHMPFAVMSDKASDVLVAPLSPEVLTAAKTFNQEIGNIYNGSLFLSLLSLLSLIPKRLDGETVGMFSYGSGAIGERFYLTIQPTYDQGFFKEELLAAFTRRERVSFETYVSLMETYRTRERALEFTAPEIELRQRFALAHIRQGHREYVSKNDVES
jgi:hydroxymethylglutaryl-CoA synthase